MDAADIRRALKPAVSRCVVRHPVADIELASGKKSDFYFDGRVVTLTGRSLELVARLVLAEAERLKATAIGGPTIGADPIVGAALALAAAQGLNLKGFLIRKEPKSRGLKRQVEGPPLSGERALLVEDTVTSGGSILQAAEALAHETPDCRVVGVMAVVDRQEGGVEALAAQGLSLTSIFTKSDFESTAG